MTNTNYPSATPQDNSSRRNGNKNLFLGILAAALLGSWGYFLYSGNKTRENIEQKDNKIASVTSEFEALKGEYDNAVKRLDDLTGDNNRLQGDLSEREKTIANLRSQISAITKKKNASEAEVRQLKSLIAQLNDQIMGLEEELGIERAKNQELTAANTQLTAEKEVLTQNLTTTTAKNEELTKTVDVASTFSASNIQITPVNEKKSGKEKTTTTAKRVDKLVVSFDVENRIALSGPADLYVMVTSPDGNVITDASMGSGTLSTRNDGERSFTSKVSINYEQGTRKAVSIPIRHADFKTGDYKIEVYHNGFKIGEGTRSLKKGGLFG